MSTKTRNKRKKTTPVVIDLTSVDESIKTPPRPSKKVKQEKKKAPKKPPPPPSKPKATPKPKVPPSYPRPPPLDFKIPKKQASIPDRGDPIDSSSEESSVITASKAQIDSWLKRKPKEVIDYKGTIVVPQDIWIQVKAVQVNLQSHLLEVIRGALTSVTLGEIFSRSVQAVRNSGNDFPNCLIRRKSEYNLDLKGKFVALPQETFQRARLELWFYYYLGRKQKVSYKEVREVIARTDIEKVQEKE